MDVRKTQLFLDDETIEQGHRLERVVHQPHKYYGNPLYRAGAPWEGYSIHYLGGVYPDYKDHVWKAWYAVLYPPTYPEITFAICMITSTDGIHWERPELDVYRGHNGEWTNIVLDMGKVGGTSAPTIIYEPENEPDSWTMVISSSVYGTWEYKAYILRSHDGVHWKWEHKMPDGVLHGMGDRCTALRGPDTQYPYVLMSRGLEDHHKWGLVRSVHRVAVNTEAAETKPTRVLVPDFEDGPVAQIYHANGFPYGDTYIGYIYWYLETDDSIGTTELMTSRDTVTWYRLRPRRAFLPPTPGEGAVGAFDSRRTEMVLSPPVRGGTSLVKGENTLWLYYLGGTLMHGGPTSSGDSTQGLGMGLAQLRVDGFCGLRARRFPGYLVTKPLEWPGGKLLVNASVLGGGGNGSLQTEVLTEDLRVVEGLTREDTDVIKGDVVEQTWNGDGAAIDKVKGHKIRLKFYLDNAELFSFRASAEGAV